MTILNRIRRLFGIKKKMSSYDYINNAKLVASDEDKEYCKDQRMGNRFLQPHSDFHICMLNRVGWVEDEEVGDRLRKLDCYTEESIQLVEKKMEKE